MLWTTEAVPTYPVPGPGMIKIGVYWPRGKLNKGAGQVCRLQVGWFIFEKWPPEVRGEEKEGKRPRQGDSGIFLRLSRTSMSGLHRGADVKASS